MFERLSQRVVHDLEMLFQRQRESAKHAFALKYDAAQVFWHTPALDHSHLDCSRQAVWFRYRLHSSPQTGMLPVSSQVGSVPHSASVFVEHMLVQTVPVALHVGFPRQSVMFEVQGQRRKQLLYSES
jgi:hypothetical protein